MVLEAYLCNFENYFLPRRRWQELTGTKGAAVLRAHPVLLATGKTAALAPFSLSFNNGRCHQSQGWYLCRV